MKYGVGVIGGGSIARKRHLPEFSDNPHSYIAAVCDKDGSRAEELAKAYDAKAYTDYKDLISDKNVNIVVVCATNTTHAKMTIEALRAGKQVLCEKPMAASVEEARQMIKAAEETKNMLFIGHNLRFAPAHMKAKQILKSGQLGKVITFRSVFGHPGCEFWAIDKGKTWFFNKKITRFGCLGDLGIHKIDLMRWMMEDEFTEVTALAETLNKRNADGEMIDVEDNVTMILKTKEGVTGDIILSWTYQKEDNSTTLYCENGVMVIYGNPKYQIEVFRNDQTSDHYNVGEVPTNIKQVKSGIVDEFVDCLVNGRKPTVSGYDGLASLKVVFAAYESSEGRKTVEID
jgi:UDP-N-acetylglucosamine 3-dehydrogenase